MDVIHLSGAEDVRSAANTMRAAADEMQRAALNIDGALERHQRFLETWLQQLQLILENHTRGEVSS